MSHNTFGHLFRVTTWGESHGPAIGCVIDGCPPHSADRGGHPALSRQAPAGAIALHDAAPGSRPGENPVGVFPDEAGVQVTTGTPIALVIENEDQRSKDYSEIKDKFRPGHADYTYLAKYGIRDYRGGGRSSVRETAMRVVAGAVARKVLPGVKIQGALVQIGPEKLDRAKWDWDEVDRNPFSAPTRARCKAGPPISDEVRKNGSSCGAIVEIVAKGAAAGLWRAALRQARPGHCCRIDEHKRGEGR